MNSEFVPWEKYPQLSRDRLSTIACVIRDSRHSAIILHEPEAGDNNWSLGCRCYVRTCHSIRKAAEVHSWLAITPEDGLSFTFTIGSIPFKFYRGEAGAPPDHYLIMSWGEIHQQQLALELGLFLPDRILRLAVETEPRTLEVSSVTLVEMSEAGTIIGAFPITFDAAQGRVTPILPTGVSLPPVRITPLKGEKDKKRKDGHAGS